MKRVRPEEEDIVKETPFPLLSLLPEMLLEVRRHLPPSACVYLSWTCHILRRLDPGPRLHRRLQPVWDDQSRELRIKLDKARAHEAWIRVRDNMDLSPMVRGEEGRDIQRLRKNQQQWRAVCREAMDCGILADHCRPGRIWSLRDRFFHINSEGLSFHWLCQTTPTSPMCYALAACLYIDGEDAETHQPRWQWRSVMNWTDTTVWPERSTVVYHPSNSWPELWQTEWFQSMWKNFSVMGRSRTQPASV